MYNNTRMLTGYHKTSHKSIVKYIQFLHESTYFIGHLGYKMHNIHFSLNKCIKFFHTRILFFNAHFYSNAHFYAFYSQFPIIYSKYTFFLYFLISLPLSSYKSA